MCENNEGIEVPTEAPRDASRRGFFGMLAGFVMLVVTLPARRAAAKQIQVSVASIEDLKKVGGSALLKVKEQKILFVRDTETTMRAVNPICSHKKCTVKFTSSDNKLHCPCHKSAFELDGKVLGGPAPKPLTTYPATLDGDKVIITLPDEAT